MMAENESIIIIVQVHGKLRKTQLGNNDTVATGNLIQYAHRYNMVTVTRNIDKGEEC